MEETTTHDARSLGELRGFSLRRRRAEPVAILAGAMTAAVVIAQQAPADRTRALALTFAVFVIAGATLGRRARWSTMLPFARMLVDLLYPAVAGAATGLLLATTGVEHVPVVTLALAALLAACVATIARAAAAPTRLRIAVVGSPQSAAQLQRDLRRADSDREDVVGVILTGPAGDVFSPPAVPVLGGIAAVSDAVQREDIDILLLDGDAARIEVFDRLAETCLEMPVRVCELTQFYEDRFGHVPVTEIDSAWFRYIMHPRFRAPDGIAKRTLDLVVALTAGIAFLPLLCVCALLIKLQDGGPVLFRQRRIGSRGQEFTLVKLRTMCTAAVDGRWASPDDERVTRVGRHLRRMHLDEMPQLLSVLRGEMSVVGPRPEQPEFVERLERTLPHYSRRHLIKPGLTGWAQVRCGYAGSDSGSAWKLCHDLYYLKHQSFGLDVAILLETVRTLIADQQFPAGDVETAIPCVAISTGGGQPPLGLARARQLTAPLRSAWPSRRGAKQLANVSTQTTGATPAVLSPAALPDRDPPPAAAPDLTTWGERTA
jgi:exopolysaccharide biosynthesis polyprenyl glycosylphosphotransferase